MTTKVQASLEQDRATITRAYDLIRRWPVIPGVLLFILVTCGVFAPLVAPLQPHGG